MTEVTHLLVNGCSWTYCQGLDNPAKEGWPRLVANRLKLPLVNIALLGSGNGSIYRRTAEYLYRNSNFNNKPLAIIMWSQEWRFEAWDKKKNRYSGVSFPEDRIEDSYQRAFIENYSDEYILRRSLLEKISLINLLKAFGVPYIIGHYAPSALNTDMKSNAGLAVASEFKEMCDVVDKDPYLLQEDMGKITEGYSKTTCGHDGKDAQVVVSEYILSSLKKMHTLSVVPGKYLSTREFINGNSDYRSDLAWS